MISLNGKLFAANDDEFINSLFIGGGTCTGYYKRNAKSVNIMNMRKEKIGVINAHKVLCKATKQDNGKYWYSYGDIPEIGRYESFMEYTKEMETVLERDNV